MSDSLQPQGQYSPWNSPGQNPGVGSRSHLQRIFTAQGSNPGLLHCGWILYQLSYQGLNEKCNLIFTQEACVSPELSELGRLSAAGCRLSPSWIHVCLCEVGEIRFQRTSVADTGVTRTSECTPREGTQPCSALLMSHEKHWFIWMQHLGRIVVQKDHVQQLTSLSIRWRWHSGSSAGKESTWNAEGPGLIPGLGRSAGEGIGYPLQYSWASLVAQLVKNLPAVWETWVQSQPWVGMIPWKRE